jgi:hypothetical protein
MRPEDYVAVAYDVVEEEPMWPQDNVAAAHGIAVRQVVAAHGVAEVEPVRPDK